VPRRWRWRLAPGGGPPKGTPGFDTRVRRALFSWWPWALLAVWAIGHQAWIWAAGLAAFAFACHVAAPQEQAPRFGLDHDFPVSSPEFLSSLVGATGVPFLTGNRVEVLNNGDAFYPPMLAAIDGAERSVTMEAYIYWAGEIGRRFARTLAARARAGVRVKILLDAVGSATIGEDILQMLGDGGCQVAWYNPVRWYTLGRVNNRTHRKSLIVDGRIGFTGGAGIADQWRGQAQDEWHWRDVQIRVEGPGVMPLQAGFAQNWLKTTGEMVSGDAFFPPPVTAGDVAVQTILSSPQLGSSAARIMYYLAIVCARHHLFIANPYFVPDEAAIETLIEARGRGVDVKVMVSGIHNDNWLARQNSIRLSGELLAAGVEMYEYNRTMLHQKTMVVDGAWGTVGTTNFDSRSFALNEESNVCVHQPEVVRALDEAFLADLAICDRLTLDQWRRRSLWIRAQGLIASLLKDQT
jgi:cardiolipin synthase A/B